MVKKRAVKYVSGYLGLVGECHDERVMANGHKVSSESDENVVKMITCNMRNNKGTLT